MAPIRLCFTCVGGSEYHAIFKVGDDLRQDQLVLQIITLMDKLFRKESLDLKLTPYKALATGTDQGLAQLIESQSLSRILKDNNNSLLCYLRLHNPDPNNVATHGIQQNVMNAYVKSCAGYCVITYILGVGDRHLDNLMLTPRGNLFHIDFGYILGNDPKPFPPPMKLCKEMVEGMGGEDSAYYDQFKSYCYIAYNILRKQANLILNLFALMVNSSVPNIAVEPDRAVLKVREKFRLDLTEEEAIQHFDRLMKESVGALFDKFSDMVHDYLQYWKQTLIE